MPRSSIAVFVGLCIGCASAPLLAAENTASREREALRRSNAALNEARQQIATLQNQNLASQREKDAAVGEAAEAEQRASAATARERRQQQELLQLRNELQSQQQRAAQALKDHSGQAAQSEQSAKEQARQLDTLRRELAQRTQAVAAVTQLLERATQALADAEEKNRQMHLLARQALALYRGKSSDDAAAQQELFLGLAQIRIDNVAEELRTQLDAQRLPR
jgi:gas vesicle protein